MTHLTELALAYTRRDAELRVLDAAAGDGAGLVALAEAFWAEARYAGLSDAERAAAVLARIRGADSSDGGARIAIREWARERGLDVDVNVIGFGEPLAYPDLPVQGELFGATRVEHPPWTFADGPFDVVVADVPARELDGAARERLRAHYASAAGAFTAEVPFVERLLGLVPEGGVLALRLRAAVIRREFGRALVEELGRRTRVVTVERDGAHVVLVLVRHDVGDSAALLRTLGSEAAARALRAIVAGASVTLGAHLDGWGGAIGATSSPGFDEVWEVPPWLVARMPTRPLVRGADIVGWRADATTQVAWPYADDGAPVRAPDPVLVEWLGRFRKLLETRELFGRSVADRHVRWFEYQQHHPARWAAMPSVAIARTAVYPRVALLRTPAVVSNSAWVIGARDEEDALWLAGVLGSSVAAFWMAQTFHGYPTDAGTVFETTVAGLQLFPLPAQGAAEVVDAVRRIDLIARTWRSVRTAIEGDATRLAARLDGVSEANDRVVEELDRAMTGLDEAVLAAYRLDADPQACATISESAVRGAGIWAAESEREVLEEWLVDRVHEGFADHELPSAMPVAAEVVADWLRAQPLSRAVLARSGCDVTDLLMDASVPREPEVAYTTSGLAKLAAWADGDPQPFSAEDYAASAVELPERSVGRMRRQIWRWRGRYNVPREPFAYLSEASRARGTACFGWAAAPAGVDDVRAGAPGGADQVDLDKMLQLRAVLSARGATEAELGDRMFGSGWSARDVRVTLEALEKMGAVRRKGRRFRAV